MTGGGPLAGVEPSAPASTVPPMKWHVWPAPALAVEAITALLTAQVQAGVPVIAFSATDAHGARVAGPEPVVAVAA